MYDPYPSPLRYPGGKTFLTDFLCQTIEANGLEGGVYVEPFAGGAGAALRLLFSERISEIHINDIDPCIYAFWRAILEHTDRFLELVEDTPVTVRAWRQQKSLLRNHHEHSTLQVGFATFFVNRCNRSGVLNAGPIGGVNQEGNYKIDVRFNKTRLRKKIEKIALYKERITAWNLDGVAFLNKVFRIRKIRKDHCLVYMDPPYFEKAERLYPFYFTQDDHERLADYLNQSADFRWIVSYDDRARIRRLYPGRKRVLLRSYSVHSIRIGRELMISSRNCVFPVSLAHTYPLR
jgi:DNA adenine methylase